VLMTALTTVIGGLVILPLLTLLVLPTVYR
jgi:Cu/Ag efflux pump CusA